MPEIELFLFFACDISRKRRFQLWFLRGGTHHVETNL